MFVEPQDAHTIRSRKLTVWRFCAFHLLLLIITSFEVISMFGKHQDVITISLRKLLVLSNPAHFMCYVSYFRGLGAISTSREPQGGHKMRLRNIKVLDVWASWDINHICSVARWLSHLGNPKGTYGQFIKLIVLVDQVVSFVIAHRFGLSRRFTCLRNPRCLIFSQTYL